MRICTAFRALVVAGLVAAVCGCTRSSPPPERGGDAGAPTAAPAPASAAPAPAAAAAEGDAQSGEAASPYDALPTETRSMLDEPFVGDLDDMVKRRLIRAGVVFNRTQYFIDRGVQRGISYEAITHFENDLNTRLKTGLLKIHIAFVPLARDQLFPALQRGHVDFVAAALTITPDRRQLASFSTPTRTGVSEIAVTGPNVRAPVSLDDLSGREVFVRKSSSYHESLLRLNESLTSHGKAPVKLVVAPESLEDDDVLEMVNAGLVEMTIVDDFVAEFWQQIFPGLRLHKDVAVRTGGEIAVGVRKDNPQLLGAINQWIAKYGPGTAFGNVVSRRYLENTGYVKNAAAEKEREKFRRLVSLFRTYGDRYSVDYVLMAAQGYQESRLDQEAKSHVGAIGIMQVMPATGKDLAVGDIRQIEPNIHAGVKYFRFMMDQYYKNDPMDDVNKGLMTLASYNAGPGRIRQLRRETSQRGLNPNLWFGNVERVASERIGRETVQYVSNIYKYYVAYRLVLERSESRARAKTQLKQDH